MSIERIKSRIQYTPLSDDPNLKLRINKSLDIAQNLPIKISETYPKRSDDIFRKINAIIETNQPNPDLLFESTLKEKTYLNDMLVVMCSWGSDMSRISATKRALSRLLNMNPFPEIIFVEGSTDGKSHFTYLRQYDHVNYSLLDLKDDCFRNLFLKEILWNYGVQQMLKVAPDISKICYLDSDIGFADMYAFQLIYDALDQYDVISPSRGCYYIGDKPYTKKYGMLLSCGYCVAKNKQAPGWPGFGIAMTTQFLTEHFNNELPCASPGFADCILWYILAGDKVVKSEKRLPYKKEMLEKYRIRDARIGYADNVIMHFDHGTIVDRQYRVRWRLARRCFKKPFSEFVRLGTSALMCWADTEEVRRYRYCFENLLILNRKEIKLTEVADADELYNWLMGISKHPPRKMGRNRFTINGNVMPMANVSIPVPNKSSEI